MANSKLPSHHPGRYIRAHVIPQGVSVAQAAKLLGVGRPALSNMLNGKADLSPEMARRLAQTFGANSQALLDMQARHDAREAEEGLASTLPRAHVPSFLTIKARDIENWAEKNIEARTRLAVLLRMLVHETGKELVAADFPGYDEGQRKGWDGVIEANAATPWVPLGRSGWEFGTTDNPAGKADSDYAARTDGVNTTEISETTFVFVTPRNWPGKTKWVEAKQRDGLWKSVRAYDASDLEQWLETSISARIWLAEETEKPTKGFQTLRSHWDTWSGVSDAPLSRGLFAPAIKAYGEKVLDALSKPDERPVTIAADSRDEALAFLACLFESTSDQNHWSDLAVIIDDPNLLRTLAPSTAPFLPIVRYDEAERELVGPYLKRPRVSVRPRNDTRLSPTAALEPLGQVAFNKALQAMALEQDRIDRLSRESGRSITVLRRRMSKNDAIRKPAWASGHINPQTLIPIVLVGAWHHASPSDQEVLGTLANADYQEVEAAFTQALTVEEDPPVWAIGTSRGVVSKIDALFAVAPHIAETTLRDFLVVSEYVLSEQDPAVDLTEDKRWAAELYEKVRQHSEALRRGLCETLVLLSVHGNDLFRDRMNLDLEIQVSQLVRRLLTPLSLKALRSHDRDLPLLAEAAPDTFLSIIEQDLFPNDAPVLHGLLRPAPTGPFASCPRTGLLWALETLAWGHLGRVSRILAAMSRIEIDDNWGNTPLNSLQNVFLCWFPQTSAPIEERIEALRCLSKSNAFPDVAWKVCMAQLSQGPSAVFPNSRPLWRDDAAGAGAGDGVTEAESHQFFRAALDMALSWPSHDENTLSGLVGAMRRLPDAEDRNAIWDLVDSWAASETDDLKKADLREHIRRCAVTSQARRQGVEAQTRDRAREAMKTLEARDPVLRHAWLFKNAWIEDSADEIEAEDLDYKKRDAWVDQQRRAALTEVRRECGLEGVATLLTLGEAEMVIGQYLAKTAYGDQDIPSLVRWCLELEDNEKHQGEWCLRGLLLTLDEPVRTKAIEAAFSVLDLKDQGRLFRNSPFDARTWRLLNRIFPDGVATYWREVIPGWAHYTEEELTEIIDRFLEVRRPRAAFHAVHMDFDTIETSRLRRLMGGLLTESDEPPEAYRFQGYHVAKALKQLNGRSGVTQDEMAGLEFLYLEALDHSDYGIPNLERAFANDPSWFIQALTLCFRRKDGGQDPSEWIIEDPTHREIVASKAYRLLDHVKRLPGTRDDGTVDSQALFRWVETARRQCADRGRADIADSMIGGYLGRASQSEAQVWPMDPVCEVMEHVATEALASGFHAGVINARGVHWVDETGAEERAIAEKYLRWAKAREYGHPFVARILHSLAENYDRQAEHYIQDRKLRDRSGG